MVDVTTADVTGLLVPVMDPVSVSGTVKIDGEQQTTTSMQRLTLALMSVDGLPIGTPGGGWWTLARSRSNPCFPTSTT